MENCCFGELDFFGGGNDKNPKGSGNLAKKNGPGKTEPLKPENGAWKMTFLLEGSMSHIKKKINGTKRLQKVFSSVKSVAKFADSGCFWMIFRRMKS